ncbi:hypothetical protein HN784_00815 [bacterium]|jgi:hypothetical protein|nr:hypothetical protein [bacterium]MBT4251617.1 hypothetical protein [bacterium]MBT4597666.1 hypothetical protein [bacterium]MBT6753679.1 hypothetical protein [bacterium]MBT7037816.1 hypothetical protein [bacterium]
MLRIKKFFYKNKALADLVRKSTVVLVVFYLGCFAVESILPGVVMEAFNFNILLFLIVAMIASITFSEKESDVIVFKKTQKYLFVFLLILFLGTLFIVLYRVSLVEAMVYLVACFVLFGPLKKLFE